MPNFEEGSTVMLGNIPCRIGRKDIIKALESCDFLDSCSSIHLPSGKTRRYRANGNIGYAFISFTSRDVGDRFANTFEDFQFPGMQSTKRCSVNRAHHRGFNAKAQLERDACDSGGA